MGVFTYIQDWELPNYKEVTDSDVNDIYKEAICTHPNLLIKEFINIEKRLFKKQKEIKTYSLYFGINNTDGKRTSEVRCVWGIGNSKENVIAYMCGLLDGVDNLKSNI